MGAAVARAFAQAGATVFLAGRTPAKLDRVAEEIRSAGGVAETAQVDAMDQTSVTVHADRVATTAGNIDVSFNTISFPVVQGVPLIEMPLEDFMAPVTAAARTHFITATTAARHMVAQGSGVIVLPSASSPVTRWAGSTWLAPASRRSHGAWPGRSSATAYGSWLSVRTSPPRPSPLYRR